MVNGRGVGVTLVSLLNVLVGGVVIWGGGQEAAAYWPDAPLNVGVGATGVLVGTLLIVSGFGIWGRRGGARGLAFAAGGGTVLVHAAGILLGIVGLPPGLLIGVAYPAFMMVWLLRSGTSAGQSEEQRDDTAPSKKTPGSQTRLRSAVA